LDFEGFRRHMEVEKKRNANQILSYTRRYGHILQTGNASELLHLSSDKRRHVMEAIVYFSKYLGAYHIWKAIKEQHGIKWNVQNDIAVFEAMTDEGNNYDTMIDWLRAARSKLSSEYSDILIYGVLCGLRASEVCHSISLLRTDYEKYYDPKKRLLTHYKYPELFIRNTKKAYVSIVTDDLLKVGRQGKGQITYEMMRKALERADLPMRMGYTRKIFGTFLKKKGIDTETIDLLQGRLPRSVFLRFYNRPNFQEELDKVRVCLIKLSLSI
jgi:intergrase/recombinase